MDMRAGFRMNGDDIRTRFREFLDPLIDRRNHQMDIEGLLGMRPQRLDDCRTDGEIGDVMPVHHVDMHPVAPGLIDRAHLLTEPRKVG